MSLSIANGALDRIHANPISSLNERGSKTAALINRHLPKAVELVLRRKIWSEVSCVDCLDALAICDCCTLPDGFCYAFALPKGFVRAYQVHNDLTACDPCERPLDYKKQPKSKEHKDRVQGRPLSSDQWKVMQVHLKAGGKCLALVAGCKGIRLEYVGVPDDLDTLPIDLCDAVEMQLALRIAQPLKANSRLRQEIAAELAQHLDDAGSISGAQDQEEIYLEDGSILGARHSVRGW